MSFSDSAALCWCNISSPKLCESFKDLLLFPRHGWKGTFYGFPTPITDLVSQKQGESIVCSLPAAHPECRVHTASLGWCARCLKMPGEKGMTEKPSGLHAKSNVFMPVDPAAFPALFLIRTSLRTNSSYGVLD